MAVATKNSSVKPVRYLPAQHTVTIDMVAGAMLNGKTVDAKLINAITQVQPVWTMDGASTLTITVADPDHSLWASDLFNDAIDLQLAGDGGHWTMDRPNNIGGVSTSSNQTVLSFWDYPSAVLKQPQPSISKPSDNMDLAAWCRLLVREVSDEQNYVVVVPRPGFVPEVTDRDAERAASVTPGSNGSSNADWMTDPKAGKLTAVQVAEVVLKAGFRGEDAAIAVAIAYCESTWTADKHFIGPVDDSWGLFQINVLPAANPEYRTMAYAGVLNKPLINTQIAYKLWIAAGKDFWQPWLADKTSYVTQMAEARAAVQAVLSGNADTETVTYGDGGGATITRQVVKPAEWRRAGNTWHALGQLGNRIGRRRFVALPRNPTPRLVFARDQDLIGALPTMAIGINDGLLTQPVDISLDGTAKLQQISLSAFADAWIAPPGSVVELDDTWGAADGNWLVLDVTSTTGDPSCQVTLTQPTTKPHAISVEDRIQGKTASSATSAASASAVAKVGQVIVAAQTISNLHLPYSQSFRTLTHTPPSGGYDCSAGVAWCLLTAGFPLPGGATWGSWAPVSGDFSGWGIEGPGKFMTVYSSPDHVFIRFVIPSVGTVGFDSGHSGQVAFNDPWYQDPFRDSGYVSYGENGVPFIARHWPGT